MSNEIQRIVKDQCLTLKRGQDVCPLWHQTPAIPAMPCDPEEQPRDFEEHRRLFYIT